MQSIPMVVNDYRELLLASHRVFCLIISTLCDISEVAGVGEGSLYRGQSLDFNRLIDLESIPCYELPESCHDMDCPDALMDKNT